MIQPATLSQMLTIDQFVTIVPLPLRLTVMSRRSQQSLTILTLVARGLFRLASSPTQEARVAADTGGVHTPTMTLKTAALLTPVSYTHLDVYKRQLFRCAYVAVLISPSAGLQT